MKTKITKTKSVLLALMLAATVPALTITGCMSEDAVEDETDGALKIINKAAESEQNTAVNIPEEDLHNSNIKAIGTDYNSAAPEDCTISAEFTIKDFNLDEGTLTFKAYTEELFEASEISLMQIGDTLNVGGEAIVVESIQDKDGELIINGGIEEGGTDLITNGTGTYKVHGMDDYATYVQIGGSTLPISEQLTISDAYKDASAPTEADYEGLSDYLEGLEGASDSYTYLATQITIQNGKIVNITRRWIP